MQINHFSIQDTRNAVSNSSPMHLVLHVAKQGIWLLTHLAYNNQLVFAKFFAHIDGGADGASIQQIAKACQQFTVASCTVAIDEDRFCILPNEVAEKIEDATAAFSYLHPIEANDVIGIQKIVWQPYSAAHVVKNSTHHVFTTWQDKCNIVNANICLLHSYVGNSQAINDSIFCSLSAEKIIITIIKEGKLQLHNAFDIATADDILYQIQKQITIFELKNTQIICNGFGIELFWKNILQQYPHAILQSLPNGFIYPANISTEMAASLYPLISICKYANH